MTEDDDVTRTTDLGLLANGPASDATIQRPVNLEAAYDPNLTIQSGAPLVAVLASELAASRGERITALEKMLDADPTRRELLDELVQHLTASQDWRRLESSYRSLLARVRREGSRRQLEYALLHRLGLLYRDQLDEPERAYEALDQATELLPGHPDAHRALIELLVATDNLEAAIGRLRSTIAQSPEQAERYAELYELFLRAHEFDKAWCTLNVLGTMRELTEDQRGFHDDYAAVPLDDVPGRIPHDAWGSGLLPSSLEPQLTRLFALITPIFARMQQARIPPDERVGRPLTPRHSPLCEPVKAMVERAAELVALPSPEVLLGKDTAPAFARALTPFGAIEVNPSALPDDAGKLAFLVGRCLATFRPELAAFGLFSTALELSSLLAMALRLARGQDAPDPASAGLDRNFLAVTSAEEVALLRSFAHLEASHVEVQAWLRAADASASRIGLLAARDVTPARNVLLVEPTARSPAGELAQRERLSALYTFSVSDLYADLRRALGVAVTG